MDLEPGEQLAQEMMKLRQELPAFQKIWSSPLRRCSAMAEDLSKTRGVPFELLDDLAELDFGHWEGRAWNDISKQEIDLWNNDIWHAAPYGGESVNALKNRALKALKRIDKAGGPSLIITHAGVIRTLLAHLTGDLQALFAPVAFGAFVEIEEDTNLAGP